MIEFRTVYPKTISLLGGKRTKISVDKNGVEQLSIVVKKSVKSC